MPCSLPILPTTTATTVMPSTSARAPLSSGRASHSPAAVDSSISELRAINAALRADLHNARTGFAQERQRAEAADSDARRAKDTAKRVREECEKEVSTLRNEIDRLKSRVTELFRKNEGMEELRATAAELAALQCTQLELSRSRTQRLETEVGDVKRLLEVAQRELVVRNRNAIETLKKVSVLTSELATSNAENSRLKNELADVNTAFRSFARQRRAVAAKAPPSLSCSLRRGSVLTRSGSSSAIGRHVSSQSALLPDPQSPRVSLSDSQRRIVKRTASFGPDFGSQLGSRVEPTNPSGFSPGPVSVRALSILSNSGNSGGSGSGSKDLASSRHSNSTRIFHPPNPPQLPSREPEPPPAIPASGQPSSPTGRIPPEVARMVSFVPLKSG